MGKAQSVTAESFEQDVLNSEVPVLVDFWAEWCGPCLAMAPVIDALAEKYEGKAKVVKMDIDAHKEVVAKYQIRSIPTLMVFKNGEVTQKTIGGTSMAKLEELLEGEMV